MQFMNTAIQCKNTGVVCCSLLQWIIFLSELSPVTRPSLGAHHHPSGVACSFVELRKPLRHNKAVIHEGVPCKLGQENSEGQGDLVCCSLWESQRVGHDWTTNPISGHALLITTPVIASTDRQNENAYTLWYMEFSRKGGYVIKSPECVYIFTHLTNFSQRTSYSRCG